MSKRARAGSESESESGLATATPSYHEHLGAAMLESFEVGKSHSFSKGNILYTGILINKDETTNQMRFDVKSIDNKPISSDVSIILTITVTDSDVAPASQSSQGGYRRRSKKSKRSHKRRKSVRK
jgi:hypothetical protein